MLDVEKLTLELIEKMDKELKKRAEDRAKMKAKFNVGDKVRILDGRKIKNYTGEWVISSMAKHIGESHTIKRVNKGWDDGRISYSLNDIVCQWDERGLEAVKDEQKIVITIDGKTTTARMFEGKKLIKSADAKCHPDDDFDFETGAKVAFDRLVEREEKVKPKELLKNGVFGKAADDDWFVVVGDSVIYKRGMFDRVEEFSEDLDDIVALIAAKSFNEAQDTLKNNPQQVIWRNPKWMK